MRLLQPSLSLLLLSTTWELVHCTTNRRGEILQRRGEEARREEKPESGGIIDKLKNVLSNIVDLALKSPVKKKKKVNSLGGDNHPMFGLNPGGKGPFDMQAFLYRANDPKLQQREAFQNLPNKNYEEGTNRPQRPQRLQNFGVYPNSWKESRPSTPKLPAQHQQQRWNQFAMKRYQLGEKQTPANFFSKGLKRDLRTQPLSYVLNGGKFANPASLSQQNIFNQHVGRNTNFGVKKPGSINLAPKYSSPSQQMIYQQNPLNGAPSSYALIMQRARLKGTANFLPRGGGTQLSSRPEDIEKQLQTSSWLYNMADKVLEDSRKLVDRQKRGGKDPRFGRQSYAPPETQGGGIPKTRRREAKSISPRKNRRQKGSGDNRSNRVVTEPSLNPDISTLLHLRNIYGLPGGLATYRPQSLFRPQGLNPILSQSMDPRLLQREMGGLGRQVAEKSEQMREDQRGHDPQVSKDQGHTPAPNDLPEVKKPEPREVTKSSFFKNVYKQTFPVDSGINVYKQSSDNFHQQFRVKNLTPREQTALKSKGPDQSNKEKQRSFSTGETTQGRKLKGKPPLNLTKVGLERERRRNRAKVELQSQKIN